MSQKTVVRGPKMVHFVRGLPFSGKSNLLEKLQEAKVGLIIDEPQSIARVFSLIDNSDQRTIYIAHKKFCNIDSLKSYMRFFQPGFRVNIIDVRTPIKECIKRARGTKGVSIKKAVRDILIYNKILKSNDK